MNICSTDEFPLLMIFTLYLKLLFFPHRVTGFYSCCTPSSYRSSAFIICSTELGVQLNCERWYC